jgi:MFS family permease
MLVLSLTGTVIGYLLSALSLQFGWLFILILSRFITGLMESNFAIVRAMATDLESISKYKSLGKINGVAAIGYVMGPLLGGFLSDNNLMPWFSFAFPFFVAMGLSIVALLLAVLKLSEKVEQQITHHELTIWQRCNLVARFKVLFESNPLLKQLLIISTIFTFAIDIFYEFGPVYLTGLWAMTPAGIALYNASLSVALAVGSGWLPHQLSLRFSVERVSVIAMLVTAIIFGLMTIFPSQIFVFILFGVVGLTIAVVNTNITVEVSNSADKAIQGEAMGAQLSLRMLGDTVICLIGGFLIISSVILPIALSCLITLVAVILYGLGQRKFRGE